MDIFAFPPEILPGIVKFMRPEDITHFRLTCWQFYNENAFLMVWVSKVNFCHILRKKKVSFEFFGKHATIFHKIKKSIFSISLCEYLRFQKSPNWFIDEFIGEMNKEPNVERNILEIIYRFQVVPIEIIEKYVNEISRDEWYCVFRYQNISESFIEKYADRIPWDYVFLTKVSEEFIEKHIDKCGLSGSNQWAHISRCQKLSPHFIDKYADKLVWRPHSGIQVYQTLTEELIKKHFDKTNWRLISIHQKLSESFIDDYAFLLDWKWISKKQVLSESFIEKHINRCHWRWISSRQKLSESFIEKHVDDVDWPRIFRRNDLSDEFRLKWAHKVYTKI